MLFGVYKAHIASMNTIPAENEGKEGDDGMIMDED